MPALQRRKRSGRWERWAAMRGRCPAPCPSCWRPGRGQGGQGTWCDGGTPHTSHMFTPSLFHVLGYPSFSECGVYSQQQDSRQQKVQQYAHSATTRRVHSDTPRHILKHAWQVLHLPWIACLQGPCRQQLVLWGHGHEVEVTQQGVGGTARDALPGHIRATRSKAHMVHTFVTTTCAAECTHKLFMPQHTVTPSSEPTRGYLPTASLPPSSTTLTNIRQRANVNLRPSRPSHPLVAECPVCANPVPQPPRPGAFFGILLDALLKALSKNFGIPCALVRLME